MSLDKAIQHGKEKRKPYYRADYRDDRTERPGGSSPIGHSNRTHVHKKRLYTINEQLREMNG